MEKLFLYLDFSIFDFFFSFDVPTTEQNQVKFVTWLDYYQIDLAYEETVNNFINFLDWSHRWHCRRRHGLPLWTIESQWADGFHMKWTTFWPFLLKYEFYVYVYLVFLWLPLIVALIIMSYYVYDLSLNIYFGYRFQIQRKTKTFFYWHYDKLRRFYWIIFAFYPRYNKSFFLKFPNPNYILNTYKGYFEQINQRYKYLTIFFFFFMLWYCTYDELDRHWIYQFFAYFFYSMPFIHYGRIFLLNIGLWLKLFFLKRKKNTIGLRKTFLQKTFFVNWYFMVIFYGLMSQFVFINIYIVKLFCNTFFRHMHLWDGYFLSTLHQIYFFSDLKPLLAVGWTSNNHRIYFDYWIGLDGINIWMIWLTYLLVILCVLFLWENQKNDLFFSQMGWIFLLLFASIQFFSVISYFWMYIFFELSLLPIFVLVVYWGSNRRKIHAAYQMVLFTFIGSIFLLGAIFLIYFKLHTFNLLDIIDSINNLNSASNFSSFERKIVWLFMFIGFAVKTPLYPFHIWLPEAHSEAPTAGSVLLAGVLLKMGTYGFMRFVMPTFPDLIDFYKTLLFSMCICGVVLSSLAALAQIDIKKIIAYSSIGHMGLVILGLCTLNQPGLTGGCFMMLSHGLVSSALFFCIGLLYKIYGTRSVLHYSAIAHFMPKFAMCFYVFILANMGFPGTAGFPAEVLIFSSVVGENFFITLLMGLGSIIGGTYSIWLLTRVLYGQINSNISIYRDLKPIERKVVGILAILVIIFGVFPYLILDFFKPYCSFFELKCIFPYLNF